MTGISLGIDYRVGISQHADSSRYRDSLPGREASTSVSSILESLSLFAPLSPSPSQSALSNADRICKDRDSAAERFRATCIGLSVSLILCTSSSRSLPLSPSTRPTPTTPSHLTPLLSPAPHSPRSFAAATKPPIAHCMLLSKRNQNLPVPAIPPDRTEPPQRTASSCWLTLRPTVHIASTRPTFSGTPKQIDHWALQCPRPPAGPPAQHNRPYLQPLPPPPDQSAALAAALAIPNQQHHTHARAKK